MNYFLTYTFYVLVLSVLMGISTWKLFKKMGYSPFFAFIPFYNYYIILKETENPKWWSVLSYLPIVGPIMMTVFHLFLMKKFGKTSFTQRLLTVILPFIYMAVVNYGKDVEIEDEKNTFLLPGEEAQDKKKETFIGSITFAVVFATIIHVFITQPFGIPTGSMERTLLVGDFLFVNKLNYGYRMPMRPLAIPFLQGTIYNKGNDKDTKNDPKSYVEAVQLPYFRLPGWEKPKRNDIVVFNYPEDSAHTAIDRKDPYVKRLVAEPGDIIEFKAGKMLINGKPEVRMGDADVQHSYYVETGAELDIQGLFKQEGFISILHLNTENPYFIDSIAPKYNINPANTTYLMQLTDKRKEVIKNLPQTISVSENIEAKGVAGGTFPKNKPWNPDWYGPLQIPKKGDVITLTEDNLPTYKKLISVYEGNNFENKNGKFFINGQETNQYTVKYDYYMMIGDNRDASLDSRFFGFVPETHIVGKPMFTWMSIEGAFADDQASYQADGWKFRWDRMFKATNTGEKDKHSYLWLAAGLLVLFFGWEYFTKLFKKKDSDE
ncbi:MAG: signal peptidase I [Bergeyella sp.]